MRLEWVVAVVMLVLTVRACAQGVAEALPEGDSGIAAKYPGDAGIEKDGEVIFADGFEGFENWEKPGGWSRSWANGNIVQPTEKAENVHGGKRALEITLLRKDPKVQDSCGTVKHLEKGEEALFLRYYVKFDKNMDVYHGGGHNGGGLEAASPGWPDSTPGVKADGKNKFSVLLDTYRHRGESESPGFLVTYVYHPEQRTNFGEQWFPSGRATPRDGKQGAERFGERFKAREDFVPERDRWYCFELMVQANTPEKRDGRVAFWVDGKLKADFPDLRLRDVAELKINRIWMLFSNLNTATKEPVTLWFDDVVAARRYIGPRAK